MQDQFARGLFIGLATAAVMGGMAMRTVMVTGTGPVMMGDLAEQWTASELRKLRRSGWVLINHFSPRVGGDIDHVLVGPGGAFAVETKWTANAWLVDGADKRIADAAEQASANAQLLESWYEFRSRGIRVWPLVVLWGAGTADPLTGLDDNLLTSRAFRGLDLVDRLRELPGTVLTPAEVDAAWRALDLHVRKRDPHELARVRQFRSLQQTVWLLAAAVGVGLAAFLPAGELVRAVPHLWGWYLICLAAAAAAWPLRRRSLCVPFATAWQVGVGLALLLVGVADGAALLR